MARTKRSSGGDAPRITKNELDHCHPQHQQQEHEHEELEEVEQLRETPYLENFINYSGSDSSPTASTKAARKRRNLQQQQEQKRVQAADATRASNGSSPPDTQPTAAGLQTPKTTQPPQPRPPSLTSAKYEGISLLYGMGPPITTDLELSSPTLRTKAGQRQQQHQQGGLSVSSSPPASALAPDIGIGIGDWLEHVDKLRSHGHKLHDHDQRLRDLESENRMLVTTVLRLQKRLEEVMRGLARVADEGGQGWRKELSCSASSSEPVVLGETEPDENDQDEEEEESEDAENKDPLKHGITPPRHAQRRVASNREGARQPMAQLPVRQFYSSPSAADIESNLNSDTNAGTTNPNFLSLQPGVGSGGRSSTPKRHRRDYGNDDYKGYADDCDNGNSTVLNVYDDEVQAKARLSDDAELGGGKLKRHEARAPGRSTTRRDLDLD